MFVYRRYREWATLTLRRLQDHGTTRLRVAVADASLSLRSLRDNKSTSLQVAAADASQTNDERQKSKG